MFHMYIPQNDTGGFSGDCGPVLRASPRFTANRRFNRALFSGWLYGIWTWLTGRSNRLINLCDYASQVKSCHYGGMQTVSISDIRGSEGRSEDFDNRFHPLSDRSRDRWLNIAIVRSWGHGLPPVELIQAGLFYFVRDGHHRISVAKALGEQAVDAEVTVWQMEGCLSWEQEPRRGKAENQAAGNQPWKAEGGYGACAISG